MKFTHLLLVVILGVALLSEAKPRAKAAARASKKAAKAGLVIPPECQTKKCIKSFIKLQKRISDKDQELAKHGNVPVDKLSPRAAKRLAKRTKRVEKARLRFLALTTPATAPVGPRAEAGAGAKPAAGAGAGAGTATAPVDPGTAPVDPGTAPADPAGTAPAEPAAGTAPAEPAGTAPAEPAVDPMQAVVDLLATLDPGTGAGAVDPLEITTLEPLEPTTEPVV